MHTHSRALDYHPHIHAVIPAAAINKDNHLWWEKPGEYSTTRHWLKYFALNCLRRSSRINSNYLVTARKDGWSIVNPLALVKRHWSIWEDTYTWRDPGKRYPVLPGWQSHLPLSRQQNQTPSEQDRLRDSLSVAGSTACSTQGIPPSAKLWLFASQQQNTDQAVDACLSF